MEFKSNKPLTLEIIPPSDHVCYILKSTVANRIYIGYTVDFNRRLRQHNGEIVGGAKKTRNFRPWYPICVISGFYELSSALRFEYRLQHQKFKKVSNDLLLNTLNKMLDIISKGDGVCQWPYLNVTWYGCSYRLYHPRVFNQYN